MREWLNPDILFKKAEKLPAPSNERVYRRRDYQDGTGSGNPSGSTAIERPIGQTKIFPSPCRPLWLTTTSAWTIASTSSSGAIIISIHFGKKPGPGFFFDSGRNPVQAIVADETCCRRR
jgi:hypothetical protein